MAAIGDLGCTDNCWVCCSFWATLMDFDIQGALDMTNIVNNLWRWLFMRSSQNAAHPNPGTTQYSAGTVGSTSCAAEPIELVIEEEGIVGSTLSLAKQKTVARGPGGELIRSDKKWGYLCSCGHLVGGMFTADKEVPQGLFSKCYVCQAENAMLASAGIISIAESELRSLVCNKCVRVTVSGQLCCPRHSLAVPDANGATIYLGPEEQQELKRKQLIQNTLAPFWELFCDQASQSNFQKEVNHE